MIKRALLNVGGFVSYVGAPLIPVAMYWDFFVAKDAKTTISTAALLVIVAGISVTKYIFKGDKLPFKPNFLWVMIAVMVSILMPIMEKLLVVAYFGIGGSVGGSFLFKMADRSSLKAKEDKQATQIAMKLEEHKNV